ncbi:MAG: hypothetical protein WCJ56_01745 [bacterium]
MRYFAICICALMCTALAFAATPIDNPVATYYTGVDGYPAWTDNVQWNRTVDMSTYAKGKTNFEKFENARDEMAAQGGGVLYYPAGNYDFSEGPYDGPQGRGLMLKSGVVIRGEAPAEHPNAATDGKLALTTTFTFGMQKKGENDVPKDWNVIGLAPTEKTPLRSINNVGICWVHMVGATIYFGPELVWGTTWAEAKSWKSAYVKPTWAARVPDGTHPSDPFLGAPGTANGGKLVGTGSGRLVFGCVLEKAAFLNDYDTCGRAEAKAGFGPAGFHMAKFAARVSVYGSQVLVANNLLPKSEGNFIYEQGTAQTIAQKGNAFKIGAPRTSKVMWDYGRTMGVDINKELYGLLNSDLLITKKSGYFAQDVVVQDNWVWNHGHKGYNISGDYAVIRHNRNERIFQRGGDDIYGIGGGWRLTLDGFIESSAGGGGMISDNLARAFDMGGSNMWIDNNSFLNTGSNPGNDGEGILCQAAGGTSIASWAITHNTNEGSIGGNGKGLMGGFNVDVLGLLVAWNKTAGYAGTLYRKPNQLADIAIIGNTAGEILPDKNSNPAADGTGTPLFTATDIPTAPKDVTAIAENSTVRVNWTDTSDKEAGFRVQRSMDGGPWTTISYRAPHREGNAANPQDWLDITAPVGHLLSYRVIAINVDDTDIAASAATPAIILPLAK